MSGLSLPPSVPVPSIWTTQRFPLLPTGGAASDGTGSIGHGWWGGGSRGWCDGVGHLRSSVRKRGGVLKFETNRVFRGCRRERGGPCYLPTEGESGVKFKAGESLRGNWWSELVERGKVHRRYGHYSLRHRCLVYPDKFKFNRFCLEF